MPLNRFLSALLASTLLCSSACLAASERDNFASERAEFQRAYEQVDAGEPQRPDSEALRAYPLYPYLQAARIRRALATVTEANASVDQRAQTFAMYHQADPVGRSLQRVWLTSLAEREQWAPFLEQYREDVADDSLRCFELTARVELDRTDNLAADIRSQWLTPRSLPDCERPFDWLKAQNGLPPELVEQRARLALEENNPAFARQLAAMLPSERAAPLMQWAALLEKPQREIDALIASSDKVAIPEAQLAGWTRLARTNRDATLLRYDAFVNARRLTGEAASPYALALAMPLAWDRRPEALDYFDRVTAADLDENALEWRARAALWAGDWTRLKNNLAAMSGEQRKQARWRYWAARAAEHTNDPALARQLYESVLIDDNFYSIMAAARLDRRLSPHPERLVRDPVQLKELGELPEFVRARELVFSDLRNLAPAEWRQGSERLSENARRQSVHLAAEWGWYDQAIASASQLRIFNDYQLLYPSPFDREVRKAARLSNLNADLIYSVMRQESLYRADAQSAAGARGLLQMLPETARRTARTLRRPRPAPDDLFDPEVNVPLGAAHLRELIDRFGGQTIVALAGYNAGPNAANRWLPPESIDPDVWVENIPYNETRNYVQRILWHNIVFGWLRTGEPQQADEWLARVAPLSNSTVLGQAD